jgi:hypothetical protein
MLNERQVRWAEFLAPFHFILKHRPGRQATIPDALSRREQDVPLDDDDSRVAERQQTLLPPTLWANTPSELTIRVNLTRLDLPCPFLDDDTLRNLWDESLRTDSGQDFWETHQAVSRGDRQFPKNLNLQLATGECDIYEGHLRYSHVPKVSERESLGHLANMSTPNSMRL